MSDYTRAGSGGATHFTDKDALTTGDVNKVIVGSQFDDEFNAILTAVNSKHDSAEFASQAEVEAETTLTKIVSPGRLAQWADENGGIVGELQELADPNADRFFMWDDSATANANVVLGTAGIALAFSGTAIELSHLGFEDLVDPDADRISYWDDSAGKFDWLVVNTPLTITGLNLDIDTASATAEGVIELATDAETNTGTATDRTITPANLAQATSLLQATATQKGAIELATDAETNTGTATDRAITPANLAQATSLLQATDTQKGAVELATQAEVDTGTDTDRAVTPSTLQGTGNLTVKVVTADINSTSETLADVTGLTGFTIVAGKHYAGKLVLPFTQDVGNLKFALVYDQTPVDVGWMVWRAYDSAGAVDQALQTDFETTISITTMGDGIEAIMVIDFAFEAHATVAGTLKVQFARDNPTNTTTIRQDANMNVGRTN